MKLHEQAHLYHSRCADAARAIEELEQYLTSNKFAGPDPFDKYVNRDDVLRWLEQNIKPVLYGREDYRLHVWKDKSLLLEQPDTEMENLMDYTRTEI